MQRELTRPGTLLDTAGRLTTIGWSRQPLLEANLEKVQFYPRLLRPLQRLRVKRWDYYALFTPRRFVSATIADLGYAGNVFVYTVDFTTGSVVEASLVTPPGSCQLPRGSQEGQSRYANKQVQLAFQVTPSTRQLSVQWPGFNHGQGLEVDVCLEQPPGHESMNLVVPIGTRRFYYNTKINCLPVRGTVRTGGETDVLTPETCLGSLDWGRGVWEYQSFWNWASASGFLPDGRTVGLNLGSGFGNTTEASEDCLILAGKVHKLEAVKFEYRSGHYLEPWRLTTADGRLELTFTPFQERVARTNLLIIQSEVHQVFGRYHGRITTDSGEVVQVSDLIGFAEEHHARW